MMEFWEAIINKVGVSLYNQTKDKLINEKISFQMELAMTGKVKNYPIKMPSQPMRRQ